MNKKLKILLGIIPLTFFLTGCGKTDNTKNNQSSPANSTETSDTSQSDSTNTLKSSESESSKQELGAYTQVIEEYKCFINAVIEGKTEDSEKWMEEPWAYLVGYFNNLKNQKDIKQDVCYALKDLSGNGKSELILLLNDYTIQAIYTLAEDGTLKLVDNYWERKQGFLYKPFAWHDEETYPGICICSYGSDSGSDSSIEISTLGDYTEETKGLLLEEKYVYDENKTGKTHQHFTVDGGTLGSNYDTHCFYSNLEKEDVPISEYDYRLAYEKYVTTDQTKRIGLELKPIF